MGDTSSIGKRIHDRRIELGYSVESLAEKLGKNRATVYRYESDAIENFPVSVIAPLAEALKTTPAYLMGWDENDSPIESGGYAKAFRERLEEIIIGCDQADLDESGIDLHLIHDVIHGNVPLSFETACEIADQVGMSLDEIMGKKDPALMSENEVDSEIIQLLSELPPEKLRAAVTYIRFLTKSGDM